MDIRHQKRIAIFQDLFASDFSDGKNASKITPILEKKAEIDRIISEHATRYPIEQMAKVDLAVLRLAVYELYFEEAPEPQKVVIDEAVQLAREYGKDQSFSFVNGVLAAIIKSRQDSK